MEIDRTWMYTHRLSLKFKDGLSNFLDHAFAKVACGDQVLCPCKQCKNRYWFRRDEVWNHVIVKGFVENYFKWNFHGEGPMSNDPRAEDENDDDVFDNIDDLLSDRFRGCHESERQDGMDDDARKFYSLLEEGKQELYPGCKSFTTLSFTIRLLLFKTINGVSNAAFSGLLALFKEVIPHGKFPKSFNEAKNMVKDIGLQYEKIHACPNDCMLYWKGDANLELCPKCHTSRWKLNEEKKNTHKGNVPAKVLWYFPLKPRLRMLYMCSETAEQMTWHDSKCPRDGKIRHPADGDAWKKFDSLHPNFGKEARNVRLGLASDGFNPFRTMSIAHSTWPVVLINYNIHPSLSMKSENLMLSLLIPGPHSPGNDIDVYLQPLIADLKDLWTDGFDTYDKYRGESFKLHAAVLWTISDFPGYSMLSGYKTKGKFACPECNYDTPSLYLKHSKKTAYMGHRRYLDVDDPKRNTRTSIEKRLPPKSLTGLDVFEELSSFNNVFGKAQKKKINSKCAWKKRSIFFELPYWKFNECRHNLDVMHIEKNICDSLVGTLLDIPGKTKDHTKARLDLVELGIKKNLQPVLSDDGKHILLKKARFSLSNEEKELFCLALKGVKLPNGCGSDISRCVHVSEKKVSGYKSHDAHIMLHFLLQIAIRRSLPKHVAIPLIRFGAFFKKVCSKVFLPEELDQLEKEIKEVLCDLEEIFLPCFFDIMIHLPIHLVREIRLGGPVPYRWMYFMERYLCKLKTYVRNRSRPEGSIAEGYLIEECLTFCSRYLQDGVNRKLHTAPNDIDVNTDWAIFNVVGHPLGGEKRKKGKLFTLDDMTSRLAHRYILFNSDNKELEDLIQEHQEQALRKKKRSRWAQEHKHSHEFPNWLKDNISHHHVSDNIFWLAKGPCPSAKRYPGYFVNGYDFYMKDRDERCRTQNSGVTVTAMTNSFASSKDSNPTSGEVVYYGAILDIIELNYWSRFKVVLFRCEWYQIEKDDYGLTCINSSKFCSSDDPFVLPSQVHQVFYVVDPIKNELSYVMERIPRGFFDFERQISEDTGVNYWEEPTDHQEIFPNVSIDGTDEAREDLAPIILDAQIETVNVGQSANETINEYDDDDDDEDNTLWDWMHASDEEE